MNKFSVQVGESACELEAEDLDSLNIVQQSSSHYHLLDHHQSFQVEVLNIDLTKKEVSMLVNGNTYSLAIKDELDLLVKELGFSTGGSQKQKFINAPMPGLILDILVEEGAEIQKGDPLLILEAMKMENILKAEGEGVVKNIEAIKGAAVEKGQLLIEME